MVQRPLATLSFAMFVLVALVRCSSDGVSGPNVVPVTVGNCGAGTYANEPCISVGVCAPGTNNCQIIPNILVDTGSFGLRVFRGLVQVPLIPVTDPNSNAIAECVSYAGNTADWGPVQLADITLGQTLASSVPIQLIDVSFGQVPQSCQNPDVSPQSAGFNGILGIGILQSDCGATCANSANNNSYFACSSQMGCQGTAVPLESQVANPLFSMAGVNNGFILTFPSVSGVGQATLSGSLILGIGTQSNNTPPGPVSVLATDAYGDMVTLMQGATLPGSSFDSGTNGYFFPSSLPPCPGSTGLYCPSGPLTVTATNSAIGSGVTAPVTFVIQNAQQQLATGFGVLPGFAGTNSQGFLWGLPFFYGRTLYFGLQNQPSTLGVGPYFAF